MYYTHVLLIYSQGSLSGEPDMLVWNLTLENTFKSSGDHYNALIKINFNHQQAITTMYLLTNQVYMFAI